MSFEQFFKPDRKMTYRKCATCGENIKVGFGMNSNNPFNNADSWVHTNGKYYHSHCEPKKSL